MYTGQRERRIINLFVFADNNPLSNKDIEGLAPTPADIAQQLSQQSETILNTLIGKGGAHIFRGTLEAVLAEAQGAEFVKSSGEVANHLQGLRDTANAIRNAKNEIISLIEEVKATNPGAAAQIGDEFRPLLDEAREYISLAEQTEQLANDLRIQVSDRLAGVPLATGPRTLSQLVSVQLQRFQLSLIPDKLALSANVRNILDRIRQIPVNAQEAAIRFRGIAASIGASLTVLARTGTSALARFFGTALEGLANIASRLSTFLVVPDFVLKGRFNSGPGI